MKAGDKVKCKPPYGPHIGKTATILENISDFSGPQWFKVELEDGKKVISPAKYLEPLENACTQKEPPE